jgi:hypothetical protein
MIIYLPALWNSFLSRPLEDSGAVLLFESLITTRDRSIAKMTI